VLGATVAINGAAYVQNQFSQGILHASILDESEEYTGLTSSYFRIEGTAGDVLEDFVMDFRGKTVKDYTVKTPTNSLSVKNGQLLLTASGSGTATFDYRGATCTIDYTVYSNPNAVVETPVTVPDTSTSTPVTSASASTSTSNSATVTLPTVEEVTYKTVSINANGAPASGLIMYIDDSKNAFKTTGTFYIEETFLDGNTHAIYIAKFTNKGPVAYKVCEFTSMAGDVNFMNFNENDVDIYGFTINIKTSLSALF
jgi:hypothetical protein